MRSISKFRVRVVVLNATFNNISFILWLSFLLMGETGVPGATSKFRIIFQGESEWHYCVYAKCITVIDFSSGPVAHGK